jgi:hypothetical protein
MTLLTDFQIGLAAVLVIAGLQGAPSQAAERYDRSASWTSCAILRSEHGQSTLQGLLARQWIVGYVSGRLVAAPKEARPVFRESDEIMAEVRRYCQAHPHGMAVDAAETILPVSAQKP